MSKHLRLFSCLIISVLLGRFAFASQTELLDSLQQARSQFEKKWSASGVALRTEEYVGSALKVCWEIQILEGFHIARHLGRNIEDPLDDRVFVFGPKYMFTLQVVSRDQSGVEKYNLVEMTKASKKMVLRGI